MADERLVGEMWCREVLAVLSDYVDGELAPTEVAQIQTHLAGCNWCEQFGGQFSALVTTLREEIADAPQVPEDVEERLLQTLGLRSSH